MGKIFSKSLAKPDVPIFRSGVKFSPVRGEPLPAGGNKPVTTAQRPNTGGANEVLRISRTLDFAARKHVGQRRKGEAQEPYVNHLAEVARLVAEATEGADANLVMAALLHDTIEDQGVKYEELVAEFGSDVADLVREVTDDKTLPKAKRKQLQVDNAPHKSPRAKLIKIADKTSNLRSILASPPTDWSADRKRDYFDWAAKVVAGCRGFNLWLEEQFDEAFSRGLNIG